jgi:hypothetical protein
MRVTSQIVSPRSWALALSVLMLSACASVPNLNPPFADPASPMPHAVLTGVASGDVNVFLTSADGEAAQSSADGPSDVRVMYLLPGEHLVRAYCMVGGVGLGVEFRFGFEAKPYTLACKVDGSRSLARLVLSHEGEPLPYEQVRLLRPGGQKY